MTTKKIKTRRLINILTIVFALAITTHATAANIETKILQFKDNRFYFAAGREALVYPNCDYVILNGDDSIYSGKIEVSSLGVSYSYPVNPDFGLAHPDGMTAAINTADSDSVSAITLGAVYFNQAPYSPVFPDLFGLYAEPQKTNVFFTESGNAIIIKRYISPAEMQLDFESGVIDGYFSYKSPRNCEPDISIISAPAPYFVALLPNVSTVYNQRGLMTASLYYRMDDGNIGNLFGGDGVTAQNCPMAIADNCPRPLPHDPIRGQQLLNVLKPIDGAVRISSTEREFQPTAMFFTDILWRDKVETRLQLGRSGSDLYIAPVPVKPDSLSLSLEYIAAYLSRDTVSGRTINKNLQLLDNYIKEIKRTPTPDRKLEYAARGAELLWQDMGVFPLYRPRVYFVHRDHIGMAAFNENGQMNLRRLVKLKLPGISRY